MIFPEKWIWLDKNEYPQLQNTRIAGLNGKDELNYTVVEFRKDYMFDKTVKQIDLRFSGDTSFLIYLNDQVIASGPVPVGSDFLGNNMKRGQHYASQATVFPESSNLNFYSRVKMGPVGIYEFSQGQGGFMLSGLVTFEDNTKTIISTDESWLCRHNTCYTSPFAYDASITPEEYKTAALTENVWHCQTAPLPQLNETEIIPECGKLTVKGGERKSFYVEFDKIYAAYLNVSVECNGLLKVNIIDYETEIDSRSRSAELIFNSNHEYRGIQVHSIGGLYLDISNESDKDAIITPAIISVHYPVTIEAVTKTNDEDINLVLDVCRHTLKICRQHIHLDSPCHYEPLACTGDYYIESLMTAFSFGDMHLAEFDVIRTAELIRNNKGRMFHTTYSLIWVKMLYDVFRLTGNKNMLETCYDALIILLELFNSYIGENSLIENPPDYMFVDWLYIDNISLHHPTKSLGQSCLNMFYFGALEAASKIFDALDDNAMAQLCITRAERLKEAVNSLLFDKEKHMYCEGLDTPTPKNLISESMPENNGKIYYRKHANILAAYVGICEKELAQSLIHRIMNDTIEGEYQAYFAHYLFEAIYLNGLRDEYTLMLAQKWKKPVKECTKGLVEGFVPPEPTYSFDHSHAWGGTPLYSIPLALTGIEMVEPGYKKIRFNPSLIGFKKASVQIPTPYGIITVNQESGKTPEYIIPDGINVE